MSKSIIINEHGSPKVLKIVETKIEPPGPKEIRIKNVAIGLNFIDTYHRSGLYPLKLPSGLGMEGSGIVEEIGSEVKNFSKGDNVPYASPPLGSYSDVRNIPEKIAVKIPDGITHKIAASIMTKGLTVHYLLFKTYKIKAGETVLFHAAAGGVGQIFCQWAKNIGCKIIGTVGSDSKIDIAKENGCDFVINYNKDSFDKKVIEYLPEFNNNGKDKITVRNLLLHNSGLIAFVEYYRKLSTKEEVINAIMNSELKYPTGTDYVYSDLGMITLQQIIEKLAGKGLDEFLEERIFKPMGMNRTMYNPSEEFWYDVLPTEVDDYWRMTTVKAKVHDENAYMLGGVAGHAGLFSTAEDLSKFMQMMLNKGVYKGKRYFKESTVETWTTKQTDQSTRGLGWDTKSEENSSFGTLFSMNSFGHTGFTGTSVWADKDNGVYVVLLTNRVYPTRDNREIVRFRPKVTDAIAEAVLYETE